MGGRAAVFMAALGSVAALVAVALVPQPTVAQAPVRAGPAEATIGGQFQVQALTSSCSGFPLEEDSACTAQSPAVDWFVRRARLAIGARVDDRIEGRLQAELAGGDVSLLDGWGRLHLSPAARLTVGQFKRPFDGFQMTSSARILTIERDLDIPGVPGLRAASLDELTTRARLSDRDVGFMLDGATPEGRFRYWIATFSGNGPGAPGDLNTEKQVVARGQVTLRRGVLPPRMGVAGAATDVPYTRATSERAGRTFGAGELWAELGDTRGGPHVQAGLVAGGNPLQNRAGEPLDLAAGDRFARMWAFQVAGGYRFDVAPGFDHWIRAVQPVFRVTRAEPNRDVPADENWGLTPGVQLFLAGENKVALNWDLAVFTEEGTRLEHSAKLQYQLHF